MTKRLTLVLVLGVAAVTIPSLPAISACHSFFFNPTTYTVNEGAGSVSVTVERDATVAPSQVKVSTVDGTAKAGQDFAGIQNQTVVFGMGAGEKAKPVSITIINDTSVEGSETFKVHLSEPGNAPPPAPPCRPDFIVGPDATVTIQDNDSSPQSSPTQPGARTSPRTSPTASPTATVSPTSEATTGSPLPLGASPTESPTVAVDQGAEEDDGIPTAALVAVGAIALAAVAGGALWILRRRAA